MAREGDKEDLKMSATERWKEELYNEVLMSRTDYLMKRRKIDPAFTIEVMDEILEAEYRKQDLAWSGKSPVQEITEAATIAAYESFRARWEEELSSS
jgi:hypothetical protein